MPLPLIRFLTRGRPTTAAGTPHDAPTPTCTTATVPAAGPLFAGLCAFFSNSCSISTRAAWVHHGGTLARAEQVPKGIPIHLFFVVEHRPSDCETRLEALGLKLHDQRYVWDCLDHKSLLALEPYLVPSRQLKENESSTPSQLDVIQRREMTAPDPEEETVQSEGNDHPSLASPSPSSSAPHGDPTSIKTPIRSFMFPDPVPSHSKETPSPPKQFRPSDLDFRFSPASPLVTVAAAQLIRSSSATAESDHSDSARHESPEYSSSLSSNSSQSVENSLFPNRERGGGSTRLAPFSSAETRTHTQYESDSPDSKTFFHDSQLEGERIEPVTLDDVPRSTTPPLTPPSPLFDLTSLPPARPPRIPLVNFIHHFNSVLPPQAELRKGLKELKPGYDGFVAVRKKREGEDTGRGDGEQLLEGSAVNHGAKKIKVE
ncbi:BZ3500_MvSof-1268-A1-R1_Chr6-3g08726 [Microbotryum saponariae]|uniref:BZ3500_MvSof-1268-A1-R1_Chr6-3g08726 protein n=1 Tax=Microbotryum saponariae TaxID=289078 RepID=A0A2X0MH55_9BASI|nr:BZ3500_MvSof-1268-A1-R1_Chr6-3g08726 [Microbotryum saponariae]SDA07327.1 BZ3501_MvSof-1269-A2-R1_Chr6-2g08429 [Microbotryum saponariae]